MKNKKNIIHIELKINQIEIALFTKQLATLISAGIPLIKAIISLEKTHKKNEFKKILTHIIHDLNKGYTFSECLKKHNNIFDDLSCSIIQAGEKSGTLVVMLEKLSTLLHRSYNIKIKIKKTLTYPITILAITLIISIGLLVFIVPEFEKLFLSFNAKLPKLTLLIVFLSIIAQKFWWLLFSLIIFLAMIFKKAKQTSSSFKQYLDKIILFIPVLGPFIQKSITALLFSILATLLSAGIPLIKAIYYISQISPNSVYRIALNQVQDQIIAGLSLSDSFNNTKLFPSNIIMMIHVGEQSGELEMILAHIAQMVEEELDHNITILTQLMEPIFMLILGTMIGIIVIALYLPLFKMGSLL